MYYQLFEFESRTLEARLESRTIPGSSTCTSRKDRFPSISTLGFRLSHSTLPAVHRLESAHPVAPGGRRVDDNTYSPAREPAQPHLCSRCQASQRRGVE